MSGVSLVTTTVVPLCVMPKSFLENSEKGTKSSWVEGSNVILDAFRTKSTGNHCIAAKVADGILWGGFCRLGLPAEMCL